MIELSNAHMAAILAMRGGCKCIAGVLGVGCGCVIVPTQAELLALGIAPPAPRKPAPQVCPEVWNSNPVNAEQAMAAVRAMCGRT